MFRIEILFHFEITQDLRFVYHGFVHQTWFFTVILILINFIDRNDDMSLDGKCDRVNRSSIIKHIHIIIVGFFLVIHSYTMATLKSIVLYHKLINMYIISYTSKAINCLLPKVEDTANYCLNCFSEINLLTTYYIFITKVSFIYMLYYSHVASVIRSKVELMYLILVYLLLLLLVYYSCISF